MLFSISATQPTQHLKTPRHSHRHRQTRDRPRIAHEDVRRSSVCVSQPSQNHHKTMNGIPLFHPFPFARSVNGKVTWKSMQPDGHPRLFKPPVHEMLGHFPGVEDISSLAWVGRWRAGRGSWRSSHTTSEEWPLLCIREQHRKTTPYYRVCLYQADSKG